MMHRGIYSENRVHKCDGTCEGKVREYSALVERNHDGKIVGRVVARNIPTNGEAFSGQDFINEITFTAEEWDGMAVPVRA